MPVISGGNIIEGSGTATLHSAGAPGAGTDEVQTLTIGGTPTGGTFRLAFEGYTTAAITWSATNATLIANIDTALGALPPIGAATNVTVAEGTMTAGIGTATITFVANLGKQGVGPVTVALNSLTGTSPTLAVADTTPGVGAHGRGMPIGTLSVRDDTGVLYINTGTAFAPTWTVVGAQT